MTIIAPSLLAADWTDISAEMNKLTHPNIKWIHFDVMDGKFVPAITYTPEQLKEVARFTHFSFDVHLMVEDPISEATKYAEAGADSITFHFESTTNPNEVIKHIKELGCKVGISIKPSTPQDAITRFLDDVDIVLIMSVEPGKGGQGFIPESIEKIKYFSSLKKTHNFLVEVDGGVKDFNSKEIIEAGADVLVAGSYIFNGEDYSHQVEKLLG